MPFKDILIQLDNHPQWEMRLQAALVLAQRSGGRVIGLYGFELPAGPQSSLVLAEAFYATNAAARETYQRQRDGAFDDAAQIEAAFQAAARGAGVSARWEIWPEKPRDYIATLSQRARYADLTILAQTDPAHPLFDTLASLPAIVMLACGRPVLVLPHAARCDLPAKRIAIAWNGTREAARAVADALPFLSDAEVVRVFGVSDEGDDRGCDQDAQKLVDHLAQHGIRAGAEQLAAMGIDVGEIILSRAGELDCDLLVMGGYGHSRAREFMIGGVTRTILRDARIPVLLSH